MSELWRWDVLNAVLETTREKRFLEIGIQAGVCGSRVRAREKWGVDPEPKPRAAAQYKNLYRATSDAFFASIKGQSIYFDAILVDGLHHGDQVLRDVENALDHLAPGGAIVLHDCNPQSELAQRVPREVGVWNGDCWRAMVQLRRRPDLDSFTIGSDHGIGLVFRRPNPEPLTDVPEALTYAVLEADRKRLLGLVSADRWRERAWAPLRLGRVVVACGIFGGRDTPKPAPEHDVDGYVLFTDGDGAPGWTLKRLAPTGNPRAQAREIKSRLLEHVDADVVVWVDGRVRPTGAPLRPLLSAALASADVAAYPHPWRSCAYDEAAECSRLGLAPAGVLEAQVAAYREARFPARTELFNTMVLARRRTPETLELGKDWERELRTRSLRDQVSFPFVLWKLGLKCAALGPDVYREGSSQHFIRGAHSGGTRE